jgi:hypothetical protein
MRDRALTVGTWFGMIVALILSAFALSHVDAQPGANRVLVRGNLRSFAALSATGSTPAFIINGSATHTTQLIVTGTPTTCTGRLQGSNDGGTTWFNITAADITCTSSIVSSTTGVSAYAVRFTLLTLTGGTSPTITAHYSGI